MFLLALCLAAAPVVDAAAAGEMLAAMQSADAATEDLCTDFGYPGCDCSKTDPAACVDLCSGLVAATLPGQFPTGAAPSAGENLLLHTTWVAGATISDPHPPRVSIVL